MRRRIKWATLGLLRRVRHAVRQAIDRRLRDRGYVKIEGRPPVGFVMGKKSRLLRLGFTESAMRFQFETIRADRTVFVDKYSLHYFERMRSFRVGTVLDPGNSITPILTTDIEWIKEEEQVDG